MPFPDMVTQEEQVNEVASAQISLSSFQQLWAEYHSDGFNIFFGAGISRDAPTNGPIWNEIQAGFLSAVFDRMEAEGWPIAEHFPIDRKIADKLDIRPEIFWRRLLEYCPEDAVWKAIRAVDCGSPNDNHFRIASWLKTGSCRNAMTTNFDEHIEPLLGQGIPVEILSDQVLKRTVNSPVYTKLHGTVGNSHSLAYTLEQYDRLTERNMAIAGRLAGRPLIIAGYSGLDTDVLPALAKTTQVSPCVVILRHPGSPKDQPVFGLGAKGSNVHILESSCDVTFPMLGSEDILSGARIRRSIESNPAEAEYQEAASCLSLPLCPLLISMMFMLVGQWDKVRSYAWLAHDACTDERYQRDLSPQKFRKFHLHVAYALKISGDEDGANIMIGIARKSLDETGGSIGEAMHISKAEARILNVHSQINSDFHLKQKPSNPANKPSDLLEVEHQVHELLGQKSETDKFMDLWQIAMAQKHEGDFPKALETFGKALPTVTTEHVGHLERVRYLLDHGGTMFKYSLEIKSADLREQANTLLQCSAVGALDIGDWITNAKANLMLAQLLLGAGLFDRARSAAVAAQESGTRTGDKGLCERIESWLKIIEASEQDS
jgi:hypothetical protein